MLTLTQSPEMVARLDEVAALVGQTPLHRISRVWQREQVSVWAKLEWYQLGNSIKARPALEIVREAILSGQLGNGQRLLDATSGNTGIGYAAICARMGIPLTLCLPADTAATYLRSLRLHAAELHFSPAEQGIQGAIAMADAMAQETPHLYFYADQYRNDHNWRAHYHGTAREIYHGTQGQITHFVAGMGTTGTLMGTGKKLKEVNADIQVIGLHPTQADHQLPGWRFLEAHPTPPFFQASMVDAHLTISDAEASTWAKRLAREEGLLVSRSAAANLAGAIKVAQALTEGNVVTVFPDDASRYLGQEAWE